MNGIIHILENMKYFQMVTFENYPSMKGLLFR